MSEMTEKTAVRVGRPKRADQNAAAERIIETATALFASRGFAGTSMEQVAAACGAGKDTIYRRFPSKVALFEAVVAHAHARALARLDRLEIGEGDALERLTSLMRAMLHINMDPDLIALKRISFSEAVVFEKQRDLPGKPDAIMDRLIAAVAEAQETGNLMRGEASAIATHLIHCLVALPTSIAMLGGADFDEVKAIDTHFDTAWAWLLNGVSTLR